ncbi:hypothetical protein LINGRAHAP2_LOCUS35260 [Linum grandiflorum]
MIQCPLLIVEPSSASILHAGVKLRPGHMKTRFLPP